MEALIWKPILVLGVLCLQFGYIVAFYEQTCTLESRRESPRGVCGGRLSDIVQMVCSLQGGYVQKWFRKRSETESLSVNHLKNLIMGKKDAMTYLRKRRARYGEQGITCECCVHHCSFKELSQYCMYGNSEASAILGDK